METQLEHDVLLFEDDLRTFAMRLTEGNDAEADKLFREFLIYVRENADKYIPGANLKAWSYTMMRNCHLYNLLHSCRAMRIREAEQERFVYMLN